jgi:hypothetical protein
MKAVLAALSLLVSTMIPHAAFAWGDDGHKVVALIAQQYLTPEARRAVTAMLAADSDSLTRHDIASEATWADKYRDSNHRHDHYIQTRDWHFVDIELDNPDISAACFGRAPLPAGTLASNGPPQACVIDKIKQFADELAAPGVDPEERLFALKFLLHLVGDMHQPLHSSDNHDHGGNQVKVMVDGFNHKSRDNLHSFWDTQFVRLLGESPPDIATQLMAKITPALRTQWENGSIDDWAMEAYAIAKADVYGNPPLSKGEPQFLDEAYVARAQKDVALQLSRAGVRLAFILNRALGSQQARN